MLELILTVAIIGVVIFIIIENSKQQKRIIEIINKQIEFIDKNIKERVVYTNQEYVNEDNFSKNDDDVKDIEEEFNIPEDLTPEEFQKQMEGRKK